MPLFRNACPLVNTYRVGVEVWRRSELLSRRRDGQALPLHCSVSLLWRKDQRRLGLCECDWALYLNLNNHTKPPFKHTPLPKQSLQTYATTQASLQTYAITQTIPSNIRLYPCIPSSIRLYPSIPSNI
mgnify:CR=1 FL=1